MALALPRELLRKAAVALAVPVGVILVVPLIDPVPLMGSSDPELSGLRMSPSSPAAGAVVVLGALVANPGDLDATDLAVGFFVDDHLLAASPLAELTSGASALVLGPSWTATPGRHLVRAVLSVQGDDSDLGNNERRRVVVVLSGVPVDGTQDEAAPSSEEGSTMLFAPETVAEEEPEDQVLICHQPGGNSQPATVAVPRSQVERHMRHGDTMGACPQPEPEAPPPEEPEAEPQPPPGEPQPECEPPPETLVNETIDLLEHLAGGGGNETAPAC